MSVWVLSKKRERMGERENIDVWSILKLCRVFLRVLAAKTSFHGTAVNTVEWSFREGVFYNIVSCVANCVSWLSGVTIEFLYNLTIESCSSWFCQPPSIPSATLLSCSEYSLMLCPLSSFFVEFFRFFCWRFFRSPSLRDASGASVW